MKNIKICALSFAILFTIMMAVGCSSSSPECEHDWVEATCTTPKTCSKCKETVGEALRHEWKEATCIEPKTCKICNITQGEKSDNHVVESYETIKNATCSAEGEKKGTCTICNLEITETIPPTGEHNLDSWQIVSDATCTSEGTKEAVCTVCGQKFTETIKKIDHVDDNNWVISKSPTANSSGEKATHCSICGAVMQTAILELSIEEKNAIKQAEQYLSFMAFSRSGLIDQLEFEGFSTETATFAVDNISVDWNEQAAKKAQDYLDFMAFSRSGLIDQLEFEGFTAEQAEYGAKAVGY